jgi:hypothetical protein
VRRDDTLARAVDDQVLRPPALDERRQAVVADPLRPLLVAGGHGHARPVARDGEQQVADGLAADSDAVEREPTAGLVADEAGVIDGRQDGPEVAGEVRDPGGVEFVGEVADAGVDVAPDTVEVGPAVLDARGDEHRRQRRRRERRAKRPREDRPQLGDGEQDHGRLHEQHGRVEVTRAHEVQNGPLPHAGEEPVGDGRGEQAARRLGGAGGDPPPGRQKQAGEPHAGGRRQRPRPGAGEVFAPGVAGEAGPDRGPFGGRQHGVAAGGPVRPRNDEDGQEGDHDQPGRQRGPLAQAAIEPRLEARRPLAGRRLRVGGRQPAAQDDDRQQSDEDGHVRPLGDKQAARGEDHAPRPQPLRRRQQRQAAEPEAPRHAEVRLDDEVVEAVGPVLAGDEHGRPGRARGEPARPQPDATYDEEERHQREEARPGEQHEHVGQRMLERAGEKRGERAGAVLLPHEQRPSLEADDRKQHAVAVVIDVQIAKDDPHGRDDACQQHEHDGRPAARHVTSFAGRGRCAAP